jgi:hypothetical protein
MKIFTENLFSEFILKDGEVIHGLIVFMSFDGSYRSHYLVKDYNLASFRRLLNTDRQGARKYCERFDIDRIKKSRVLKAPVSAFV